MSNFITTLIDNQKVLVEKANKSNSTEYASVFSIENHRRCIVETSTLRELQSIQDYIQENDISLNEVADELAKTYFKSTFRFSEKSLQKPCHDFEQSVQLNVEKNLFRFFMAHTSNNIKEMWNMLR